MRLVRYRICPASAHQGTCTQRLDGLQTAQGFNQNGVLVVAVRLRLFGQLFQLWLHCQTGYQHDRNGQQRYPCGGAANQPDDKQKQNRKRNVDKRGQRGRGQKVADRLELFERTGQCAGAAATRLHLRVQNLLEQRVGNRRIRLGTGHVEKVAAHGANDEVADEDDGDTDDQRDKRIGGIVGDDAVINNHREHRTGQREDVDEQCCQRHLRIDPAHA